MQFEKARQQFRAALAGDGVTSPASVFDAASARMAKAAGFELGILAGSVASMAILGAPDLTVISSTELAEQVGRIARADALPLMVDADHGYGNALNVARTVAELECHGASAITLEDTLLPRAFGQDGAAFIPVEEMEGKLGAALAARRDPGLVIVGRTATAMAVDIEEAIMRCRRYEAVGVDAVHVAGGLRGRADLDRLADAVRVPIILGRASGELTDLDYLASRGVRILLRGNAAFQDGLVALYDSYTRQLGTPRMLDRAALVRIASAEDKYRALADKFMGGAA